MRLGVIALHQDAQATLAAGADYIEPLVVGNLVVEQEGQWVANPEFIPSGPAPAFAGLFPPSFRLADPSMNVLFIRSYVEVVMAEMAKTAEPGAKLVLGSGTARSIPEHLPRRVALRQLGDRVRMVHEVVSRHGVELVVEPLTSTESNVLNTIAETVAFLEDNELFHVRVVADLHHLMTEGESLATVSRFAPWIGHVHLTDTGHSAPGQGDWPLTEFITALREGGYRGDISVKGHWNGGLLDHLRDGLAHLRSLTT